MGKYLEIAGSGKLRVTTRADVERAREAQLQREMPNTIWPLVDDFNEHLQGLGFHSGLAEKVWVASRCLQLNAQQISRMELKFEGTWDPPPAWLAVADPVWFPNGVHDSIFAMVWDYYSHGETMVYPTAFYASGFPSAFMVLDPQSVHVELKRGRKVFTTNDRDITDGVVHIIRNPRGNVLRGTPALSAYATPAWNIIAGSQTTNALLNNLPPAVLKSSRRLTAEQAESLQNQYASRAATRATGIPPILPPEIELVATNLGFSPKDLLLLDSQEWDARVLATAYGVPGALLNMAVSGGLTYQNPAVLGEQWWRFELLAVADGIARALSSKFLPRGNRIRFDATATFTPLDQPHEGVPADSAADASPNSPQNGNGARPDLRPMIGGAV